MYDVIGSIHQDLHHAGYKKTATLPEIMYVAFVHVDAISDIE